MDVADPWTEVAIAEWVMAEVLSSSKGRQKS
jgi:hypothetical protein